MDTQNIETQNDELLEGLPYESKAFVRIFLDALQTMTRRGDFQPLIERQTHRKGPDGRLYVLIDCKVRKIDLNGLSARMFELGNKSTVVRYHSLEKNQVHAKRAYTVVNRFCGFNLMSPYWVFVAIDTVLPPLGTQPQDVKLPLMLVFEPRCRDEDSIYGALCQMLRDGHGINSVYEAKCKTDFA